MIRKVIVPHSLSHCIIQVLITLSCTQASPLVPYCLQPQSVPSSVFTRPSSGLSKLPDCILNTFYSNPSVVPCDSDGIQDLPKCIPGAEGSHISPQDGILFSLTLWVRETLAKIQEPEMGGLMAGVSPFSRTTFLPTSTHAPHIPLTREPILGSTHWQRQPPPFPALNEALWV